MRRIAIALPLLLLLGNAPAPPVRATLPQGPKTGSGYQCPGGIPVPLDSMKFGPRYERIQLRYGWICPNCQFIAYSVPETVMIMFWTSGPPKCAP